MRQIIIKGKPRMVFFMLFKRMMKYIDEAHMLEFIKLDFKKRIEITVMKFFMKDGYEIEDVKLPSYMEIMEVFSQKGNEYVCLAKAEYPKKFEMITRLFDLDIIWTKPTIFSESKLVMSCIGSEKNLEKFRKGVAVVARIDSVSYKKANYLGYDTMSMLTDKQKDILQIAKREGYYEYPRRIDGSKLAKLLGISKGTLIEHLRKIENKVMDEFVD